MDKIWSYIIDTLLAILIMFIAVLLYFGLRTETVVKSMGKNATQDFMSDIKKNGYLTMDDYERYIRKLFLTNAVYDIGFEHRYSIMEPEYHFRTLEEIIEAQRAAYKGSNIYHYREVVTEKPPVSDPIINDGSLNTETNEEILAKAVGTPASQGHVHTDECYAGHRHTGEPYFIHKHQHTDACYEYINRAEQWSVCAHCGKRYMNLFYTAYWNIDTHSVVGNGPHRFTCDCGSESTSSQEEIKYGWGYSCYYNNDLDGDNFDDKIGCVEEYKYKESYPQDRSKRLTHTSGCYRYHNAVYMSIKYTDYNGMPYYDRGIVSPLLYYGTANYCTIPKYYIFGIGNEMNYSDYSITYRAEMENGKLVLKYSGSSGFNYNITSLFPSEIEFSEARNLHGVESFASFVKKYLNIDLNTQYYDESVNSYYGTLNICDQDDTKANQWITTCGMEEDTTHDCGRIVTALTPTNPVQTVYMGEPLITTAIATFRDGSTNTVLCHTDYVTTYVASGQTVTITYTSLIDGISKYYSATITVTVIPRTKTCPNGHTYNLNPDGSDPGCPFCRVWVRSIRILYPATTSITITIGTTLQDNGVRFLATYLDGHTETIAGGYADNLDTTYLGTKPVTIGYKGATTQLMVTTVCAKMTCAICGCEYDLYPDGTNPGCPRCIQKTPVFTGNVLRYEEAVYTEEILEKLYADGIYRFSKDDTFIISIKNKSSTVARKILQKVIPSLSDRWIEYKVRGNIMEN